MKSRYTKEQLDFLRDKFQILRISELTAAFNEQFALDKTTGQIHSTLKNHRIVCGREGGFLKGVSRVFTSEECQFLRENYIHYEFAELTAELNRRFGTDKEINQVRSYIKNNGITSGRDGRFRKGNIPWSAGTKGIMKPNSGNFKKGQIPHNHTRLWSERIDSKDGFILINIPERNPYTGFPTRYKHKHIWLWEYHHGPVPKGMVVSFIDGDRQNVVIENLMLISRLEMLLLNLHGYKDILPELKPSIRLIVKIEAKAGFRLRPGRGRRRAA